MLETVKSIFWCWRTFHSFVLWAGAVGSISASRSVLRNCSQHQWKKRDLSGWKLPALFWLSTIEGALEIELELSERPCLVDPSEAVADGLE